MWIHEGELRNMYQLRPFTLQTCFDTHAYYLIAIINHREAVAPVTTPFPNQLNLVWEYLSKHNPKEYQTGRTHPALTYLLLFRMEQTKALNALAVRICTV